MDAIIADLASVRLIVVARAEILLRADISDGRIAETDEKIAQAVGVALNTVRNMRRKCVTLGLKAAVYGQNALNIA